MNRPNAPHRRRAAAVIEFAVVAPVFFLLILGLIELGRGLMIKHQLTNSARLGCRVGIIEGKSTSDITNTVVNNLNSQGFNGESATVQVNDTIMNATAAGAGDEISVIVSVPIADASWLPFTNYISGGNLTGSYTLRRE
jgi:Flp pilus assembly protein TadG